MRSERAWGMCASLDWVIFRSHHLGFCEANKRCKIPQKLKPKPDQGPGLNSRLNREATEPQPGQAQMLIVKTFTF